MNAEDKVTADNRRALAGVRALAAMHPCIATDTDPTPNGIIRPLFAKYAPSCPASRGGGVG